jgi:hypothetical protein
MNFAFQDVQHNLFFGTAEDITKFALLVLQFNSSSFILLYFFVLLHFFLRQKKKGLPTPIAQDH